MMYNLFCSAPYGHVVQRTLQASLVGSMVVLITILVFVSFASAFHVEVLDTRNKTVTRRCTAPLSLSDVMRLPTDPLRLSV